MEIRSAWNIYFASYLWIIFSSCVDGPPHRVAQAKLSTDGLIHVVAYLQEKRFPAGGSMTSGLKGGKSTFPPQLSDDDFLITSQVATKLDFLAEDIADAKRATITLPHPPFFDESTHTKISIQTVVTELLEKLEVPLEETFPIQQLSLQESMYTYVQQQTEKIFTTAVPTKTYRWNHPLFFRTIAGRDDQQYFAYGNAVFPLRVRNTTNYLVYLGERFAIEYGSDDNFYIVYKKKVFPLVKVDQSIPFVHNINRAMPQDKQDSHQFSHLFLVKIGGKNIPICACTPSDPQNPAPFTVEQKKSTEDPFALEQSTHVADHHVCNKKIPQDCGNKYRVIATSDPWSYLPFTHFLRLAVEGPEELEQLIFPDLQFFEPPSPTGRKNFIQ